ncbi:MULTISPECIES: hypothetical protein [Vagococcus]|uniref:Uncharacterized protein n=1 Tax=Vagococcus fluvialis bH819 TaxID=1255619 RepID=A0A1X6WMS6_9ENTE|nr:MULTISPECIES: hypothetical protein [Vagococcus]SLM84976.1 hypothetical protein FM121_02695 [Vagococcus fluvialis bH819]HCM88607.1 hypothetical protein [Vagococcus sp.]
MLKEMNQKINQINKKIGVNMEISMPSKRVLEINEKSNILISVTCLSLGTLTSSKILLGLGILSGVSAIVTHVEKKKI